MLVEGLGVDGDAHAGATVQHLWDMQKDPTKPNLRQVGHWLHCRHPLCVPSHAPGLTSLAEC